MSETTIRRRFKIDHVLTDADSAVFADPDGAYGVRRRDTGASVVPVNTALDRVSQGVYQYTFADPAPGLVYEFYIRFEHGGEFYFVQGERVGGRDGNLYDELPQIMSVVGGCPVPYVKQELRRAAVDFCRQTHVWREQLSLESVADQAEYDLYHPHDASILVVRQVTVAGLMWAFALHPMTDTLTLRPSPRRSDEVIVAAVTYLPRESNTEYPQDLIDRYGRYIADGTLARLAGQTGRPWSNAVEAERAQTSYRAGINEAKLETYTQRTGPNRMMRPERFV